MDAAPDPQPPPDEPAPNRPSAQRRKRQRNWDGYAAVIASFIGLLALLVSGYTAYLQREQVRAQVWPHLALAWSNDASVGYKIMAFNEGTGPARVTRVRVSVDGRAMRNWQHVARAQGYTGPVPFRQSTLHDRVLTAERTSYDLLMVRDPNDETARQLYLDMYNQRQHTFGIIVCYCSVLGECWMTALGHVDGAYADIDTDQPIEDCPIPPEDAFSD